MPEEMRADLPEEGVPGVAVPRPAAPPAGTSTLGQESVDGRALLLAATPIALVAALLTGLSLVSAAASFMQLLWVMATGSIVLSFYHRLRPQARIDGRVGLRVGLAAGLLSAGAIALMLAAVGVAARFGLHRMGSFDGAIAQLTSTLEAQMRASLAQQNQPREVSDKMLGLLGSPEMRAGAALVYLGLISLVLLAVTTAGAGFAGLLAVRRQRAGRLL